MSQVLKKERLFVLLAALCVAAACFITGGATAMAADGDLTAGTAEMVGAAEVAGTTEIAGDALDVQASSAATKWHTVNFNPLIDLKKLNIEWNWNDLLEDATKARENKDLLVAGIVMSEEAELSKIRVETALKEIGFEDIKSDYYAISTSTENDLSQPARTFGHKAITKNGKKYHVICAVFKGTTTLDDALTDIKSIKDGFLKAGQNCTDSLTAYVSSIDGATKENTILFITGHSLGASTANVVGRLSGDLAYDRSKFVYSIASPNYELGDDAGKDAPNFRTFTNTEDAVPYVPLSLRINNFGKIGIEHEYTYKKLNATQKDKFEKVYYYLTGKWFEDDVKTLGTLKNHLCQTYMSFALCDLDSKELDRYLGMSRENGLTVMGKSASVNPNRKTVLKRSQLLTVKGAQGKVTYAKKLGNDGFVVSKEGNVTVKKSVKPGSYSVTIAVKAAGDNFYLDKTVHKTVQIIVKRPNPITVTPKTTTIKAGKKTTLSLDKVLTVRQAKGTVTYVKKGGNKKITVAKKTGKVVVNKGLKAGKYKVKVAVKAAGDESYMAKTVTKAFVIKANAS